MRVHSGLLNDETAELCHWHAPAAHYLESWSDARAYDGTVGIVQPLIAPLYDGHSAHEIVALLTGDDGKSGARSGSRLLAEPALRKGQGLRSVLGNFAARRSDGWNSAACHFALLCALISRSRRPQAPTVTANATRRLCSVPILRSATANTRTMAGCRNRPKPVTRLTWDNAAMVSPGDGAATGAHLGRLCHAAARRPRSEGGSFHRSRPCG